jgi:hypothetical protein
VRIPTVNRSLEERTSMTDQQVPIPTAPTPPAPAKPRWWRNKKIRLAISLTGVALIILARFSLAEKRETRNATTDAQKEISSYLVGDCVSLGATAENVHRTDCTTDPSFTVGAAFTTDTPCTNDNYIGYAWTLDHRTIGRLCLVENLTAGHCYRPNPAGNDIEQIDCTTADDKAYEVVQRLDTDDPAQCAPNTNAEHYPAPARTYCLAPPH